MEDDPAPPPPPSTKKHKKKKKALEESHEEGDTTSQAFVSNDQDIITLDDLENVDEAWVVHVPGDFNPAVLTDQSLSLENQEQNLLDAKQRKPLSTKVAKKKTKISLLMPNSKGKFKAGK